MEERECGCAEGDRFGLFMVDKATMKITLVLLVFNERSNTGIIVYWIFSDSEKNKLIVG